VVAAGGNPRRGVTECRHYECEFGELPMSDSYLFAEPVALAGESLPPEPPPEPLPADRRVGLASPSFMGLLATQFLVAWNDNMFRWLVVPIGKDLAGDGNEGLVLSVGLACFVLPYLLLAAPAGWLADRFSKRSVIVRCKLAEFAIMVAGIEAILIGNLHLMFAIVALMGAQSALFSPSKLGAIPELVRENRIAAANGLFGLTTVVAIVGGLLTIPVAVAVVRKLSYDTTRFAANLLKSMMYRVRVEGLENVPAEGGALLVSNHVSYADGMLLALCLPRKVRMVVYADYCEVWWLRWFWRLARPIPIRPGKRSVVASLAPPERHCSTASWWVSFPRAG